MAESVKHQFKWAVKRFREGAKKSDTAIAVWGEFQLLYSANDAVGMEELLTKHGILKGARLQKSDWDAMVLPGTPSQGSAVVQFANGQEDSAGAAD